jgi:hypothetical protein
LRYLVQGKEKKNRGEKCWLVVFLEYNNASIRSTELRENMGINGKLETG